MTQAIVNLLSIFTVVGNVLIVALLLVWIASKAKGAIGEKAERFIKEFGKWGIQIAFLVALSAMLGSLYFSEIVGFEPCKLCWIGRIFMYPQVFILGIMLWKRDYAARIYPLALSIIGLIVAVYQYYVQMFNPDLGECGIGISCAVRFVITYGYVTIPFMTLTAFALIIAALIASKK